VFARLIFAFVRLGARKGLAETTAAESSQSSTKSRKKSAHRTGIRGETYAYWYLRWQGYTLVARNFTFPGFKGEIDIVGYDGPVLAFVEVKTRSVPEAEARSAALPPPEEAVDLEKRRNLLRMARQFLRIRRIGSAPHRFDVLAIETRKGAPPEVRLHKGAFHP
jgi:putative endonuclease